MASALSMPTRWCMVRRQPRWRSTSFHPPVEGGDDVSHSTSQAVSPQENTMSSITTKDGEQIFYKDWGSGQPIVFSHGWPLSSDDWDTQMMFFLNHGFRVIAH